MCYGGSSGVKYMEGVYGTSQGCAWVHLGRGGQENAGGVGKAMLITLGGCVI